MHYFISLWHLKTMKELDNKTKVSKGKYTRITKDIDSVI